MISSAFRWHLLLPRRPVRNQKTTRALLPFSALTSTDTRERRTSQTLRSLVFRKQHRYQHQLRSTPAKQAAPTPPHFLKAALPVASVLPALLPATSLNRNNSPSPVHSQPPTLFPFRSATFWDSPLPTTSFTANPNHLPPHNKTLNVRACGACRHHNPPHFPLFTSHDHQVHHTHSNTLLHNNKTSRTLTSTSAANHTATSISPTIIFPQTALHTKGRLTPGLGGSHPGASKLTTTKHRKHPRQRFRPHQRYQHQLHQRCSHKQPYCYQQRHPTNHTLTCTLSTHNTTTNLIQIRPVISTALLLPATPPKQATPSQAHFPQATLPPASVTPALPPDSIIPSDAQFFRKQHSYCLHAYKILSSTTELLILANH